MNDLGPTKWRAELASYIEREKTFPLANKDSRTGTVFFRVCSVCGRFDWVVSTPIPDDDLRIVIEDSSPDDCEDCALIERRLPEVRRWVQSTIKHHLVLADERIELHFRERFREMQLSAEMAEQSAEVEGPPRNADALQGEHDGSGAPDREGAPD